MTRCIQCTRCVRFVSEISGSFSLGTFGRGIFMEISTYLHKFEFDILSGNIIDLCPVGALTSMPFAFSARPWELVNYFSIDVMDALGSSIRVDIFNNKIYRVLPILDENVNEEWLTNKARFSYDSLFVNRVYYPKIKINLKLINFSWVFVFTFFLNILNNLFFNYLQVITGFFLDFESGLAIKSFFNSCGCSNFYYTIFEKKKFDLRSFFLLNVSLLSLETINCLILINLNLRLEAPLLHLRLRKNYLNNSYINLISFGLNLYNLTFPLTNAGNSISSIFKFLNGKLLLIKNLVISDFFNLNWLFFTNYLFTLPLILFSTSVLDRMDGYYIFSSFYFLTSLIYNFNKNILGIVSNYLGNLTICDIGLTHFTNFTNNTNSLFFFNNTDFYLSKKTNFWVYLGVYKDFNFFNSDIIFPSLTYFEKAALFII